MVTSASVWVITRKTGGAYGIRCKNTDIREQEQYGSLCIAATLSIR